MQSYDYVTNDSIFWARSRDYWNVPSLHSCRSGNSTEAKVLAHFPSYFVPYCHVSWILTSLWCCQGRRIKETIVDPDHEPQSSDSRCLSSVSRTRIIIEHKHREHNSQLNIFYTYIVFQALILMFCIINIHKHFSGNKNYQYCSLLTSQPAPLFCCPEMEIY